jgi:hypothetical protein
MFYAKLRDLSALIGLTYTSGVRRRCNQSCGVILWCINAPTDRPSHHWIVRVGGQSPPSFPVGVLKDSRHAALGVVNVANQTVLSRLLCEFYAFAGIGLGRIPCTGQPSFRWWPSPSPGPPDRRRARPCQPLAIPGGMGHSSLTTAPRPGNFHRKSARQSSRPAPISLGRPDYRTLTAGLGRP